MKDYREIIYGSYISNGFGSVHGDEKKYNMQKEYFQKNYLQHGILAKNKNVKVCDLGCGCGEFVRCLEESGYKNVVGIDTSPENIEFCKGYELRNAKFECSTIKEYLESVDDNCYDAFIFNDVIEHLHKQEIVEILQLMLKKLKKGGYVYIKTPNMANPFVNTAGRYIDFTHEIGFTENSMRQVLNAVGFRNIKILGTDIYVLNPIVSCVAKIVSKLINGFLQIFSLLYGRQTIKIFEKDILAIAKK